LRIAHHRRGRLGQVDCYGYRFELQGVGTHRLLLLWG
jgi:hypothetical protein